MFPAAILVASSILYLFSGLLPSAPVSAPQEPPIRLVYVAPHPDAMLGIQSAWNNALGWMEWEVGREINAEWEVQYIQTYYTNIWHVLDRAGEFWGEGKVVLLLNLEYPYATYWAGAMPDHNIAFLGKWSVWAFSRNEPYRGCLPVLGEYPCSYPGQIGVMIHEVVHLYGYIEHDDYSIISGDWARWPDTRLPEGVKDSGLFL